MAEEYPQLDTERLFLTLPPPRQAPAYLDFYVRNRERLKPWDPERSTGFYTEAFWRRQLHLNRRDFDEDLAVRFGIFERERPERLAGVANFSNLVRGCFQACHLGYTLDGELEGRGIMQEALQAALGYAFRELDLHRVMANYQPKNERSGRLLERLGFEKEGFARGYLRIDGAWRDHVLTALVRPEKGQEAPLDGSQGAGRKAPQPGGATASGLR